MMTDERLRIMVMAVLFRQRDPPMHQVPWTAVTAAWLEVELRSPHSLYGLEMDLRFRAIKERLTTEDQQELSDRLARSAEGLRDPARWPYRAVTGIILRPDEERLQLGDLYPGNPASNLTTPWITTVPTPIQDLQALPCMSVSLTTPDVPGAAP